MGTRLANIRCRLILPALGLAVGIVSACKAELPDKLGSDGGDSRPCTLFADQLIAFSLPDGNSDESQGLRALGPPDNESTSIPTNASLTLAFLGLGTVIDGPTAGVADLRLHGSIANGSKLAVYAAGTTGPDEFTLIKEVRSLPDTLDLGAAPLRNATFFRFIAVDGTSEIDALEVLESTENRCP